MTTEPLAVSRLTSAPDATVVVPGSKSITNRALACALLADGPSELTGVLFADDTEAMLGVVDSLGGKPRIDRQQHSVTVQGSAGALTPGPRDLDVRMSGTTTRFAIALAARGTGAYALDGHPAMRARPMGTAAAALRSLGVSVDGDQLPLTVTGGLHGGSVSVPADISSQFASGLLLAAPGLDDGLDLTLGGAVVSKPYLDMTCTVMRSFGAEIDADGTRYRIPATSRYSGTSYHIEPDASAASYFFGAAAVTGGRVRIDGLGPDALQGDVAFVDVLEQMGATVTRSTDSLEVQGPPQLRGIEIDMADISDTAQTLAAIAPFADSPTRVTGIDFIRNKETDRIAAVVNELQRLGIDAREEADGFLINPGEPQPGTIQTYDDHRMAMSFALVGLRCDGIKIADPDCVAKTFPTYWDVLDTLRSTLS